MASYARREVHRRTVEFVVPAKHPYGACWTDVDQAIVAAHRELVDMARIPVGAAAPDDMIRVLPGDEDVVVYFVADESALAEARHGDGGDRR
jgi:hypothetical protein